MILSAVYLAQLLCGFYNCQWLRDHPVTSLNSSLTLPNSNSSDRVSRSGGVEIPAVVNTSLGLLEGYRMGVFQRQIYAFEGIPYATAERFRDPILHEPWTGIRSAKKQSAECLQFALPRFLRVVGEEDCLELNIYTPMIATTDKNPKLPVLIFIHGGSFVMGRASDYGPTYLLQEDIILVTVNYRLGVLGFLSTGDDESPGNYGLKDQALAIKFIHDNIANFGGDPDRITIAGQSAGAASVALQMLSTSSIARGLFRGAISFSGSAAHHWALQTPEEARKLTHNFAKRLGCSTNNGSKEIMDCLRRIEPNFLVASQNNLIEFLGFPAVLFAPVIEPKNVTSAFLTESTEEAYANGHVAKIPFLCTNTAEEGEYILMVMKNMLVLGHIIRNWEMRAPLILDIQGRVPNATEAVIEIRDVYFRDVLPQHRMAVLESNVKRYAQIGSDRYFTLGNRKALKLHGEVAPTYSYLFKFKSHVGVASFLATDYRHWGSAHGEDLTILFNNTAFSAPLTMNERAYDISRMLVSLVANFVTYNVPYYTPVDGNGTKLETWKTVGDPNNPMLLEISEQGLKMIPDPMHGTEEMKVWSRLGIK